MNQFKNTAGMTVEQLANGTPSDKVMILKSFYKGDRCTISPAKDSNGRYLGINENIPEIKKLEMGYVPSPESKIKLVDDLEVDLNNETWAKDWEWMQHCQEIASTFKKGQGSPGCYFYIFRPGTESAKKVEEVENKMKLLNYILTDSAENLYNRVSILGMDMTGSVISDVKDYLLGMVETEPAKIKAVYESKTFSLELLFMHAHQKNVIQKRGGVYVFGEILLGVEKKAVIAFFANTNNTGTTRTIEAMTYGIQNKKANPLEHEAAQGADDLDMEIIAEQEISPVADDGIKKTTLDVTDELSPQQKAANTRRKNLADKKRK